MWLRGRIGLPPGNKKSLRSKDNLIEDSFEYDRKQLLTMFENLVKGRGNLHHSDHIHNGLSVLFIPLAHSSAGPIHVIVVADEAVITAGLDSKFFIGGSETGDETHLCEVIEAIMVGAATEYGIFEPRESFTTNLMITGDTWGYEFDTSSAVFIRHLPAWPKKGSLPT
jgi:hypothetical protein